MSKSTFAPYAAFVVVCAMFGLIWLSAHPGDHSIINAVVVGLVGAYLRWEYSVIQAKRQRSQQTEKIEEIHNAVNSKMEKLLEVTGLERFRAGEKQGETQGRANEVAESERRHEEKKNNGN